MKIRLYVLRNIKNYIKAVRGAMAGMLIIVLIAQPLSLISPKLFQILIDEVMKGGYIEWFWPIAAGMLGVFMLGFACDGLQTILNQKLLNRFTYHIRSDILCKYKKMPYPLIEKMEQGELKMRLMEDVDSLGNFISEQIVSCFSGILTLMFSLCMVVGISWKMTLYCLLVVPIIFAANYLIGKGVKQVNEELRVVNSEYITHSPLQFWQEIKFQNAEETFIERFKRYKAELAKLGYRSIKYWAYSEILNDFKANYLTRVLVYIIGTFFVIKGEISVGVLIMFAEYFGMLFTALDDINAKQVALHMNEPYYKRIFETLGFPEEETGGQREFCFHKWIKFEEVCFGYCEKRQVLKRISLKIQKGEYLAIVGKNGCGKTTLLKVLMGLYPVSSGQIEIDGINVNDIAKESMYTKIGVVMQDSFLFNMSIKDNLLLAHPGATDTDMEWACKKAGIYDFICSLPKGLETQIGEGGARLSGGQKQRIAIAIALMKKPEIIVFDEATSSLDRESEREIGKTIKELAGELTMIAITHKLSMAMEADRIAVMENGELAAIGRHCDLREKNMFYKKLVEEMEDEK